MGTWWLPLTAPSPLPQARTAVKPPQITTPAQGQVAPGDVLSGTAPAGSQVQIYDGSTLIGGTTAGAKWQVAVPTAGESHCRQRTRSMSLRWTRLDCR